MDINAAITWIFANHKVVLYGIGGLAVILVAFSLWGLLRGLLRSGSGRRQKKTKRIHVAPAEPRNDPAQARFDEVALHDALDDDSYLDDLGDLGDLGEGAADAPNPALAAASSDDFRDIDDTNDLAGDLAGDLESQEFEPEDYVDSFGSGLGSTGAMAVEPAVPPPAPPEFGAIDDLGDFDDLADFDELDEPAVVSPTPSHNPCTAAPVAPQANAPQANAPAGALRPAVPASEDFKILAEAIFEANFPSLHPSAHQEARGNVAVFAGMLAEAAQVKLSLEERQRIRGADVELLLHDILRHVARRRDEEKYAVLITLLIGRIKREDQRDIGELLDQSIEVIIGLNGVDHLKIVIMCLYLRSINLRSNDISELENIVKYATNFGQGANFSNLRTGGLFAKGLLMYNAGNDRVEGQMLRSYAALMEIDPTGLDAFPGETPEARQLVYERLSLDETQARTLDEFGQSQCGRATATGIGWASAAAYIEAHTGQPADWERMIR